MTDFPTRGSWRKPLIGCVASGPDQEKLSFPSPAVFVAVGFSLDALRSSGRNAFDLAAGVPF